MKLKKNQRPGPKGAVEPVKNKNKKNRLKVTRIIAQHNFYEY
jgi:hypothetical protein